MVAGNFNRFPVRFRYRESGWAGRTNDRKTRLGRSARRAEWQCVCRERKCVFCAARSAGGGWGGIARAFDPSGTLSVERSAGRVSENHLKTLNMKTGTAALISLAVLFFV